MIASDSALTQSNDRSASLREIRRIARSSATIMALVGLIGCVSPVKFDSQAAIGLHKIALLGPDDPAAYPIFSTGLESAIAPVIGGAVGAGVTASLAGADDSPSARFTAAVATQNLRLGTELTAAIAVALERDGYEVVRLTGSRKKSTAFLDGYGDLETDATAILDVVLYDFFYKETLVLPFRPTLHVRVKLVDGKTGRILFAESYFYSPNSNVESVNLPVDRQFYFKNFDELMSNAPRAAEGFRAGALLIAERIGQALKGQ